MLASRYAKITGMSKLELTLFTELWPLLNMKKSPAGTEDSESLSGPILTQIEVPYEDQTKMDTAAL